ncbi:MAG: biotin/lipoyl-containing protein [Candidatus Hodarchaeales archaeon]|jgi:3-methylcrotonyl-CoA carboxylase alpha subunit
METQYDDGKEPRKVEVRRREEDVFVVKIDDQEHEVQAEFVAPGRLQFRWENRLYKAVVAQEGDDRFVFFQGQVYKLSKREEGAPQVEAAVSGDPLAAPMPGRVVKVLVKAGDVVETAQDLVILEAMKMETRITAPFAGMVVDVNFGDGDQVNQGDKLLEIEAT